MRRWGGPPRTGPTRQTTGANHRPRQYLGGKGTSVADYYSKVFMAHLGKCVAWGKAAALGMNSAQQQVLEAQKKAEYWSGRQEEILERKVAAEMGWTEDNNDRCIFGIISAVLDMGGQPVTPETLEIGETVRSLAKWLFDLQ